jgi:hypothetical protein
MCGLDCDTARTAEGPHIVVKWTDDWIELKGKKEASRTKAELAEAVLRKASQDNNWKICYSRVRTPFPAPNPLVSRLLKCAV